MLSKGTIVMIYSLAPERQAREKRVLGRGNQHASFLLFDRLEGRIKSVVTKTGLPAVVIFDHLQPGASFGERYAAAFNQLFEAGYEKVISVGNDIPSLNESHIRLALDGLKKNQVVLGPSHDGGDYLIALSKNDFEEEKFISLPWRTGRLHFALEQLLSQRSLVSSLECLVDIDTSESLAISLKYRLDSQWEKFVKALLKGISQTESTYLSLTYRHSILHFGPRRAPPVTHFFLGLSSL